MSLSIIQSITHFPESVREKIRLNIRSRAIENAKVTIILADRDINTLSEDDLEIIIADEERKIIDKMKSMSIVGILAFFGISLF
ncbi:MAG: hypothetical protein U9N52_13455 [Campylobacterota bacterium]|nr:hypothetical protein [Campylobacterota bacterium]